MWRIETQVLHSTNDEDAMDFKKSVQDENNIVALAVRTDLAKEKDLLVT